MGAECSVAQIQSKLCGADYDQNTYIDIDNEPRYGAENEKNESENGFDMDYGISGIDDSNYNHHNTQSTGLYKIHIKDLDVSDLKQKFGEQLMSVDIVNDNELQLTFQRRGYSIDTSKSEMSRNKDGELVLMIRNHSQDYGSFDAKNHSYSLKARYRLPKGVKTIKCH